MKWSLEPSGISVSICWFQYTRFSVFTMVICSLLPLEWNIGLCYGIRSNSLEINILYLFIQFYNNIFSQIINCGSSPCGSAILSNDNDRDEWFLFYYGLKNVFGLPLGVMATFQNIAFSFHSLFHSRGTWVSSKIYINFSRTKALSGTSCK